MTVGSWDPNGTQSSAAPLLSVAQLQRFVELSRGEKLDSLENELSDAEKGLYPIMSIAWEGWSEILQSFDNDALWHLIRFLTKAEMQLMHWEAGEKSPVIAVNDVLKDRGAKLDHEKLLWIRGNSQNRFIPNGRLI